jgi:potassium channel subfamily K
MTITFWGASSGHYSKSFSLTASQRTLMLQTILFLAYLLLGALVFSKIEEDWDYLDAVYWANVTLFTVGFGDFATKTMIGRGLLLPYALIGVISLGLVISSIRRMILDRGRQRVGIRMEEKGRRRLVKDLTKSGREEVLAPIGGNNITNNNNTLTPQTTSEYERRKAEFELMRNIQDRAMARRRWMAMVTSTCTWIALWLIGALIFWETEKNYQPGWGYFDSFYLCFVSLTTIGYGDRTPISNAGKSFFVFWSLLALPTMTVLISNAEDTVVKFIKDTTLRLGAITILPRDKLAALGDAFQNNHTHDVESTHQPDTSIATTTTPDSKRHKHSKFKSSGQPHRLHHVVSRIRRAAGVTNEVTRPHVHPLNELPAGREFQLLLISEIQAVTKHLRENEPRRYTFEEWAWFLWLLGEDERNASTHRQARPDDKRGHKVSDAQQDEQHYREKGPFKWSWVGNRSPLSADQEESEWVLDRLTVRLRQLLEEPEE